MSHVYVDVRGLTGLALEGARNAAALLGDEQQIILLEEAQSCAEKFALWCAECGPLDALDVKKEQRVLPACVALFPVEASSYCVAVYTSSPYSLFASSHLAHSSADQDVAVYQLPDGRLILASLQAELPLPRHSTVNREVLRDKRAFSPWRGCFLPIVACDDSAQEEKGTGFVHICPTLEVTHLTTIEELPRFDAKGLFDGRTFAEATDAALGLRDAVLHTSDLERPVPYCAQCGGATFQRHASCPVLDGRVASESVRLCHGAPPGSIVMAHPRFEPAFAGRTFVPLVPIREEKVSRSIWNSLTPLERFIVSLERVLSKASLKDAKTRAALLLTETQQACIGFAYHEHEAAATLQTMRDLKLKGDMPGALKTLATFCARPDTYVAPQWKSILFRGLPGFASDTLSSEPKMLPPELAELWKRAFVIRRAALKQHRGKPLVLHVREALPAIDVHTFFCGTVRAVSSAQPDSKKPWELLNE